MNWLLAGFIFGGLAGLSIYLDIRLVQQAYRQGRRIEAPREQRLPLLWEE
jgi:hypothetical protein